MAPKSINKNLLAACILNAHGHKYDVHYQNDVNRAGTNYRNNYRGTGKLEAVKILEGQTAYLSMVRDGIVEFSKDDA